MSSLIKNIITRAMLASSEGASLMGYKPPGIGAINTDVQSELRTIIRLKNFGADMTGVNDSSDALRKAIAYAKEITGTPPPTYTDYQYKEFLISGKGSKSVEIDLGTGLLRLDQKILTPGCIRYKGNGLVILSATTEPVFETAYYVNDVLTSNFGFESEDDAITNSAISGLQFEGLTFIDVVQPFNLRCALWQSWMKDIYFLGCGYSVVANSCFYFNYEKIMIRGAKAGYESIYPVTLGVNTNRIELKNVCIAHRINGISIDSGASIQIYGGSFEVISGNAIYLKNRVDHVSIHDNYLEAVENFVVDLEAAGAGAVYTADGAIKSHIDIYDNYTYLVSYYVDLCGLRDSHIGSVVDAVLPEFRSVIRLRDGSNLCEAVVDIPAGISDAAMQSRYLLSNLGPVKKNLTGMAYTGLTFPTVQFTSSNPNTLDDYKEGTWSPTIIGTTTEGEGTYSVRSGIYTKIGNVVTFRINLTWTGHTGTGNMRISDLPYPLAGSGQALPLPCISYSLLTGAGNMLGAVGNGGLQSVTLITKPTGGGAYGFLPVAASGDLAISGSYTV